MYQLSGSTQGALDYNSTIIGALELSEKKWVLDDWVRNYSEVNRSGLIGGSNS